MPNSRRPPFDGYPDAESARKAEEISKLEEQLQLWKTEICSLLEIPLEKSSLPSTNDEWHKLRLEVDDLQNQLQDLRATDPSELDRILEVCRQSWTEFDRRFTRIKHPPASH